MSKEIILEEFYIPALVAFGIVTYLILSFFGLKNIATFVGLATIIIGSFNLFKDTFISIVHRQFALDYIAIFAIVIGVLTKEYLVAEILALMISGGEALENYGGRMARKSLSQLVDRIPSDITIWREKGDGQTKKIKDVLIGDLILVRKGEVIPLDGKLISGNGETDESSLTGEPFFIEKVKGDIIRSGTVNMGTPIIIEVTKEEKDSTYKKIVEMVEKAEQEKSPMIRLADKYSIFFTIVTFTIAGLSFVFSNFNLIRTLAVLAIATPCPLIIATPIALLGGMNASAKKRIIIKKIEALEVLSRINTVIFDKTGTITLGSPTLKSVEIIDKSYDKLKILALTEAIERNSLHPLAKTLVEYAKSNSAPVLSAADISEEIGKGISGTIDGKSYLLQKVADPEKLAIALFQNDKTIAHFYFDEEIKGESISTIKELKKMGLTLFIYTGDKLEAAKKIVEKLGEDISIKAGLKPEDKQKGIKGLKEKGMVVAMVGDGINDAPALALSDVGMAFSNQEQNAASEAADIVLLGGNFSMVLDSLRIARKTISIAKQSILWGIGLSIFGMTLASFGLIPPIYGAVLQEGIDVAVILNSLRAIR